ncbi:MAG: alpha/beta hydrolase [Oligoflexus sp.]|nr:alpha/beta hydrolase [Oligoflexus sp.]
MRMFCQLMLIGSVLFGCKTGNSNLSSTDPLSSSGKTAKELWAEHVKFETDGQKIQAACIPRFSPASTKVKRRGMVMFMHGFTACPQQYLAMAPLLNAKGYDVYLPLNPGHGREPFDGPRGKKDNHQTLPSTEHKNEYKRDKDENIRQRFFVDSMNAIARAETGEKILAGLSGGASYATTAVQADPDLWNRLLLYAPYYKNPGLSAVGSAVIDQIMPGFVDDWGDECRANRFPGGGRGGLCALTIGAVRAMVNFGVNAAQRIATIKIPVQFVGVEADPTADNGAIHKAYLQIADHARMCLYPKGVPHSLLNPKADAPKLDPYWVPAIEADSVAYLTEGKWFTASDQVASKNDYNLPICRTKL